MLAFTLFTFIARGQYVQPERNDTTYIYPQTKFDSVVAINALGRGASTIKGVAYVRRAANGNKALFASRINANRSTVVLFPVTPYLLEFLDLKKKKQNEKKLRFVYMSKQAWYYHYTAITNSTGEFTFPNLKPGKYYLETTVGVNYSGTYDKYAGHADDGYGGINYYQQQSYNTNRYYLTFAFVNIDNDGQVVGVELH